MEQAAHWANTTGLPGLTAGQTVLRNVESQRLASGQKTTAGQEQAKEFG